jgi:hypothetical protein
MEQRTPIKFCVKLKKAATETFEMLRNAYGEECLSRTSMFEWHQRFKERRDSLQDDEWEGRPSSFNFQNRIIDKVIQKCLVEDRTLSVRMLEEIRRINRETVRKISVEGLKKKKVRAHFVPHLLTRDQKHQRAASSVEFLEMTDDDRNVLKKAITGDEIWCFMYDLETKRQSATWSSPKKPKAQKVGMQKSRAKIMLTAFFLILKLFVRHEFEPEKQNINGNFYKEVIKRSIEFIALGASFRKVAPGIFCATFFGCGLRVFGETRDLRVIPSTLLQ